MFIGRTQELESLNKRYNSGRFECAVVLGRRRVGKTELINEFIKGKKSIFFTAVEGSPQKNVELLSKAIFSGLDEKMRLSAPVFEDFAASLDYIYEKAQSEKIVFIIDEYPYLASSDRSVSSILQQYIDHKFQRIDFMLILCGSSMSFMENQVMGYKSPLYGRRTCQYRISPFDFKTGRHFHNGFSIEDQAVIYGTTGGIPKYLLQIEEEKSLRENIIDNFFSSDSLLFEEPTNLLKQELREPSVYNGIITAIASGSSKLNEIATKSHMSTSSCSVYLNTLLSLDIIKKERPILAKPNSRNTIYRLKDGMFRFWYRFVFDNIPEINSRQGNALFEEIEQHIPDFMGEVFEEICIQFLWRQNITDRLPIRFKECGRWWGNNPIQKKQQEIDLLAYRDNSAIFAECKWKNEKSGVDMLEALIEKSEIFNFTNKFYVLFSKSGFTQELKKRAGENIFLFELSEICD